MINVKLLLSRLITWIKGFRQSQKPEIGQFKPNFPHGEMNINDAILLAYLVEYNRKNELINQPKMMLLDILGQISICYQNGLEINKLIEIDCKLKAIIGKLINEKAVEEDIYIDCESLYLSYLGDKN